MFFIMLIYKITSSLGAQQEGTVRDQPGRYLVPRRRRQLSRAHFECCCITQAEEETGHSWTHPP